MNLKSKEFKETKEIEPVEYEQLKKESEEKLKDFSELLDSISSLEDKKKALWKHIYQNAMADRNYAHIAFVDLYIKVHGDTVAHATHGQNLSKYLERMSKATDQLIKLSEIISEAQEKEEAVTTGDIYSKIGKGSFRQ